MEIPMNVCKPSVEANHTLGEQEPIIVVNDVTEALTEQPVGCKRRNAALTSDAADVAGSSGELFSDLLARSKAARTGWDRSKPGREGRRDRGVASSALGPSPPGRASSVLPLKGPETA